MIRKIYFIICFVIILSLSACGKKEKEPKVVAIGNGGNQINVDSLILPGGEADTEDSVVRIGKEKSDTIIIVINWDKIIVADNVCSSIEDMEEQIIKSGCKKIDLQHTDASKETLDEVVDVLKEIEETLEIEINYN